MRLHEGDLYWQEQDFELQNFDEHMTCDCLIIGAGVSGLLVANKLLDEGYKTIVVEKDEVGTGLSLSSMGTIEAFTQEDFEALKELEKIIATLDNNAQYEKKKSITIGLDYAEHQENQEHRIIDIEELKQVYGISSKEEGFLTFKSATINPHRLAINLAKKYVKKGGKLYKGNYIKQSFNYAYFENEARIKYKNLILTNGVDILSTNKINDAYYKIQYTILSEPLGNLYHDQPIITLPKRPMMQIRTTVDNRIMITGNETYSLKYGFQEKFVKSKQLFYDFVKLMPEYRTANIEFEYASVVPTTHSNKNHLVRINNIYHLYPFERSAVIGAIKLSNELSKQLKINHFD